VTFIGEPGIDEGGPRCEFFSLAMAKMAEDSTIYQGPTGFKSFAWNVEGIQNVFSCWDVYSIIPG